MSVMPLELPWLEQETGKEDARNERMQNVEYQYVSESFLFFIKLTLLQFISTSFRKQYRLSDRRYWWDKGELFFGIFHHIGQGLGRYLCHFGSNVVFELSYNVWLIGINFTLQKSPQKEVRWSQIRGSWWTVNIPGRVVLKKTIFTGHQDFRIWFHRNSFCREYHIIVQKPHSSQNGRDIDRDAGQCDGKCQKKNSLLSHQ